VQLSLSEEIKNLGLENVNPLSACKKCHGTSLRGRGFASTCYGSECHIEDPGYHFKKDFGLELIHKPLAKARESKDEKACIQCHVGRDNKQRTTKECKKCHDFEELHPIEEFRKDGKLHGAEMFKRKLDYCLDCHHENESKRIRSARGKEIKGCWDPSSDQCHKDKLELHTKSEMKPIAVHGIPALNIYGKKTKWDCTRCHGANYDGGASQGKSGVSCYGKDCHDQKEGFYHLKDKFKKDEKEHQLIAVAKRNMGKDNCKQCHNDSKVTKEKEQPCEKCHKDGGAAAHSIENYRNDLKLHGKEMFARGKEGFKYCLTCHGKSEARERKIGSCWDPNSALNCHHDRNQVHLASEYKPEKVHGIPAVKTGKSGKEYACSRCHGTSYDGGKSGVTCFGSDCHDRAKGIYHYKPKFKEKEVHGPIAKELKAMERCTSCHGNRLDGGESGSSCYGTDCHPKESGFPHNKKNFAQGPVHGGEVFSRKSSEQCRACHSQEQAIIRDNVACLDECHMETETYTHNEYEVHPTPISRFIEDHKNMRYEAPREILDNARELCGKCHGNDFGGGKLGITCNKTGCHKPGAFQ